MRKLTRNLAPAVVAGLLAAGAILPALAQETDAAPKEPVTTDPEPQQARVQARQAMRDPGATAEERVERLAEREAFRAERDEQRADRGAGQRGPVARPGAGEGPRGPIAGGRGGGGMGPMDGSGPNEDCPLDAHS